MRDPELVGERGKDNDAFFPDRESKIAVGAQDTSEIPEQTTFKMTCYNICHVPLSPRVHIRTKFIFSH